MLPYLFVTTFNKQGYNLYGKRMLESFLLHWPSSFKIVVYFEDFVLDKSIKDNPRVILKNLNEVQDLIIFKNRHKNNSKAHGYINDTQHKEFQFDAVRFSHKVFAIYDCFKNPPIPCKSLVWIDGDTFTFRSVPEDFLEQIAPRNFFGNNVEGKRKYGICYLGRTQQHSECGFISYNCTHELMHEFWETFINLYKTDAIFSLAEWHDSFVFDHVRKIYEIGRAHV